MTVIGQGTAAVAGQSLARALAAELSATPVRVEALPATELSGFSLRGDMTDTLVVAISQSGTTTDTNRTVDLVAVAAGTWWPSSIGAPATSPTRATACSTPPTGATWR
ncbi:MAG: hypothetical protein R2746_13955 [Acidimicrobiales bacterium]